MSFKFWSRWESGYKNSKIPFRIDFFLNRAKSEKNYKGFPCKLNSDKISRGFFNILFSRSDQFIKDFSCKFEGDFNILLNFFLVRYKNFQGVQARCAVFFSWKSSFLLPFSCQTVEKQRALCFCLDKEGIYFHGPGDWNKLWMFTLFRQQAETRIFFAKL